MKSYSKFGAAPLTAGLLSALVACGGGGSEVPAPEQPASVGGLWNADYTATNGNAIQGRFLITEDGRFFGLSKNLSNNCVGISYGSLSTSGSTFTGNAVGEIAQFSVGGPIPACVYPDNSTSSTATVSGSVVTRTSLTITATGTSAYGLALGTTTTTAQFDALYNAGSSLSAIGGSWTGPTGNLLTVSASGQLAAADATTGCTLSGQVSIINSAYDAYSATGTLANCYSSNSVLNGATINALLFIDNTTTPNKLLVGQVLTLTNGAKQVAVTTSTR